MANFFTVTIPIAGHVVVEVDATDEKEAIDKALETATIDNLETWEALEKFNEGNVCYCPQPWEIDVEDNGPVDDAP